MISLKLSSQTKFQNNLISQNSKKGIWKVLLLLVILSFAGYFVYQYKNKPIELDKETFIEPVVKNTQVQINDQINEFEQQVRKVQWSKIKSKAIYAFNPESGKVYFAKNENEKLPIASITKLATILTASNLYEKNSEIQITKQLPKMDNPVGLKAGDKVGLNDIYKCALIASHNDCPNALAYEYGFDDFVKEMNLTAQTLGMLETNFSNPTGFINTNNYSSASDLGILASVISRDSDITKITDMTSSNITIKREKNIKVGLEATNVMLKETKNIKGLKTGFTYASGECLVLFYDYGGENKLITIVLDSQDRFADSRLLYGLIVSAFN